MKYKRREKNISKLLMKTSNSMPNIFTQKHQDLKDFGVFSQYIDKQLSYYNLDPKELSTTQSIFRKTGIKIQENEKLCLPKMNGKKNYLVLVDSKTHLIQKIKAILYIIKLQ